MEHFSLAEGDRRVAVLYLDLDGTVRWGKDELGRFVNTKEDVRVFDGVPTIMQAFRDAGWRIVAVSNQGGVSLGILSVDDMIDATEETQRQCGGLFDFIQVCVHHPDAKDPEYAVCWCRKPKPGGIIEAAHALSARYPDCIFPPHMALFVGDRPEDRQAAEAAGVEYMNATDWREGGWRAVLNRRKSSC